MTSKPFGKHDTQEERDAWIKAGVKEGSVLVGENFFPDWSTTYTKQQAETELQGFEFQGPGWYFIQNDAILVIPEARERRALWHVKNEYEDERFTFYIYNNRNPSDLLASIVNAPTRVGNAVKRTK